MEFAKSFTVPLAPAQVWPLLLDIRVVCACMPGAELTRAIDRDNYEGRIGMSLGPFSLMFAGRVGIEGVDAAHQIVWIATRGSAGATGGVEILTELYLRPAHGDSHIEMNVELTLLDGLAAYNGVGLVETASDHVATQFADNLKARLVWQANRAAGQSAPPPVVAKPLSTTTLVGKMLRRAIAKPFNRS